MEKVTKKEAAHQWQLRLYPEYIALLHSARSQERLINEIRQ